MKSHEFLELMERIKERMVTTLKSTIYNKFYIVDHVICICSLTTNFRTIKNAVNLIY